VAAVEAPPEQSVTWSEDAPEEIPARVGSLVRDLFSRVLGPPPRTALEPPRSRRQP